MNENEKWPEWQISSLEDAQKVINILHRFAVKDSERMNMIEARIFQLEQPWWKRWKRRRLG